ncbi:MAG: hypothetical protein JNK94_08360 [Hyphomonadaceae bacterium]|nr:hypothetical protein [Hyphomonadaceae bacterium]
MIRTIVIALAATVAVGCAPPQGKSEAPPANPAQVVEAMPQTAEEATAQDACGASRFQHLIGTRLDAIDRSTLPEGARLLTPESIVTQDFRPDRLNIMSGTDGLVSSLSCY